MTEAQKIASQLGLSLTRLSYSDTRRIVNHESRPYGIVKDSRLIAQFPSPGERLEWLRGQEILSER
jgi:hypothetical protein